VGAGGGGSSKEACVTDRVRGFSWVGLGWVIGVGGGGGGEGDGIRVWIVVVVLSLSLLLGFCYDYVGLVDLDSS
jgi:hypothetical protein